MKYDENIYAEIVFDGFETHAPARMGTPKPDQLQGTTLERLAELAGRVCYDSLGKGRSSPAYHSHIIEVGHGSVLEHANFTIEFRDLKGRDLGREMFPIFMNRPGVWVEHHSPQVVRVTLNLRCAVEWDEWTPIHNNGTIKTLEAYVRTSVLSVANQIAPQILGMAMLPESEVMATDGLSHKLVVPEHPEEKWVSLLLGGSRGMSHEQVRHKWRTAVSQRSTRYVDEAGSPWVRHPLVSVFVDDTDRWFDAEHVYTDEESSDEEGFITPCGVAGMVYVNTVNALQPWLVERGVEAHTARKQARGAARGFLGNALHTELIFSASVAQWRRMIAQRCTIHADAEIRVLYGRTIRALQSSKCGEDFADIQLVPSPDGIGEVAELRLSPCS